jgi:Asp-tRNA(Asn)/Glu-tRNA(Gln) amidotransferase C subunit
MTDKLERFQQELEDISEIFEQLDELNQKRLEEAIIMLKTKFVDRLKTYDY